jgi:tellurite resistance protein
MTSPQTALVYVMILAVAADGELADSELDKIESIIRQLPVFADYPIEDFRVDAHECAKILDDANGLENLLNTVLAALPDKLRETAYALACDVVAADLHATQEELRALQAIRHHLDVDRLASAAIERGTRARHTTL